MTSDGSRLRLGTRRSPLALAQSRLVAGLLESRHDGLTVELVPIETRGDRLPGDLAKLGGKGLFTEELERGLLAGDLDLAVHSLKDLPVEGPENLEIVAFPRRADPRDVLLAKSGAARLADLPQRATVLTGSLRRQAQLLASRPDLQVEAVRGNVGTRLEKWRAGTADAIVLAAAGLARLGADLEALGGSALGPDELLPAPGQGTLAVQVRAGTPAADRCAAIDDASSRLCALAERQVVRAFGADCTLPLAAWARTAAPSPGEIELDALLASPDGSRVLRAAAKGDRFEEVAARVVAGLRQQGAASLLAGLS